jgi:hypothetical protein
MLSLFLPKIHLATPSTATLTITITSGGNFPLTGGTAGNKSPYLNNINDQFLIVGKVRTYILQGEDPNNESVTFELVGTLLCPD